MVMEGQSSWDEISVALERSRIDCMVRAGELGLRGSDSVSWTPERDRLLLALKGAHRSTSEIADIVGLGHRDVLERLDRLGRSSTKSNAAAGRQDCDTWEDEDDEEELQREAEE